jgi:hypothetical protein
MCIVCKLGRSPTREEIKGDILDISWCKKVREIQVPEGLQTLDCYCCTRLVSLGPLPKSLQTLNCSGCTSLTSVGPLPKSLRVLYYGNTNLTSLGPLPKGLQELNCDGCTTITSLGPLPESLRILSCSSCTNLASFGPLPKGLEGLVCNGCRVLTQVGPQSVIDNLQYYFPAIWTPSEELENNLRKLAILQKFSRSFRTRKLLRLSKTREFCEWFYHPENYGGRWAKASLVKFAEKI